MELNEKTFFKMSHKRATAICTALRFDLPISNYLMSDLNDDDLARQILMTIRPKVDSLKKRDGSTRYDTILAQYISTLNPALSVKEVLGWGIDNDTSKMCVELIESGWNPRVFIDWPDKKFLSQLLKLKTFPAQEDFRAEFKKILRKCYKDFRPREGEHVLEIAPGEIICQESFERYAISLGQGYTISTEPICDTLVMPITSVDYAKYKEGELTPTELLDRINVQSLMDGAAFTGVEAFSDWISDVGEVENEDLKYNISLTSGRLYLDFYNKLIKTYSANALLCFG